MESGNSNQQLAGFWIELLSLVGPLLTFMVIFILSTFFCMLVKVIIWKLQENLWPKTQNSEPSFNAIQIKLAQINQDIKLIQNVLVSMIPLLNNPGTLRPRIPHRDKDRGCHNCGEESHYIRTCPYLPGLEKGEEHIPHSE